MSTANIKTKCTEAKRVSVSYEAEQQAVLMWILLQGDVTSFTVQCPRKKSETSQFVEISTVEICGEKIDFSEYIEHFIEASGKALDKSSKNYNKYNKRNHIAAINNTLILLVQMSGFNVVLKTTKNSCVTLKFSRLNVLSFREYVFCGDSIQKFGSFLNHVMIEKMKGHKRDSDFVISKLDFSNLEIDNLSVEGGMNTLKGFELLGNGEKLLSVLRPVSVSSQISSPVTRQCQVEERRQNTVMESSSRVCESRFGAMTTAAATTTTTATACNGSIFRDSDFIFNDDSKRDDNNNKRNLKDILGLEQLEEEREEEVKIEEICIEEHPQPQMQIVPQVPEVQQFQQIPQMQIIPEMQIQDCGCWGDCCYYYYPCQEIVYEQAELSQNGEGLNENKSALVEGFLHHSSSSQSFENGFLQSTVFDYWK